MSDTSNTLAPSVTPTPATPSPSSPTKSLIAPTGLSISIPLRRNSQTSEEPPSTGAPPAPQPAESYSPGSPVLDLTPPGSPSALGGVVLDDLNSTTLQRSSSAYNDKLTDSGSTTSAQEANSLENFSDELLAAESKTLWGRIERIPLTLKLILMILVGVLGMVILGIWLIVTSAQSVENQSLQLRQLDSYTIFQNAMKPMEQERDAVRSVFFKYRPSPYSLSAASTYLSTFFAKRYDTYVDAIYTELNSYTYRDSSVKDTVFNAFRLYDNYAKGLMSTRQDITTTLNAAIENSGIIPSSAATQWFRYYSQVTESLNNLYLIFMSNVFTDHNSFILTKTLSLKENQDKLTFYTTLLATTNTTLAYGDYYLNVLNVRNMLKQELQNIIAEESLSTYYSNNADTQDIRFIYSIENQILQLLSIISSSRVLTGVSLDVPYFLNCSSQLISFYDNILIQHHSSLSAAARNDLTLGAVGIAVVVVVVVFFFFTSSGGATLFARTIVGPWRRLNILQEVMIQKFVPKSFLKTLKCKKITDMQLGVHVNVEQLAILVVNIRRFSITVKEKEMKSKEVVDFVNGFLNYVGPIIRQNLGFIDRYNRDGFVALFRNPKMSLRCIVELQKAIETYNTKVDRKSIPIRVGIGLHVGKNVLIGAIGEQERIQGCVLSEDVAVAAKLEALTKKYHAKMLISKESMSQISKSVSTRYLGKLKTKSEQLLDIFEIVDGSQPYKVKTKEVFSRGMELYMTGNFVEAQIHFDSAYQQSLNQDDVALQLSRKCKSLIENQKLLMNSLLCGETLQDSSLREAFEKFCETEYSQENVRLWNFIEDFKGFTNQTSRKLVAQKIAHDYLEQTAKHSVNVTAETRKNFAQKIKAALMQLQTGTAALVNQEDQVESLMSNVFFRDLQYEIEFVMTDSHRRFKNTEQFRQSFAKSKYALDTGSLYVTMDEDA